MKLSIKPVALAVTMALGAAMAHAQGVPPTMSTGTAYDGGSNDGLYLAVWDNTTKYTELVSLTSIFSNVALDQGSTFLTTPTVGTNGWTSVSNFDGYSSVDQLNLGTLANFATNFSTSSDYAVVAANNTKLGALSTAPLGFTNLGSETNQASAILAESADWYTTQTSGPALDPNTGTSFNVVTGVCSATLCDGSENITGQNLAVNVGTAAGFYDWFKTSSRGGTTLDTYSYDGQQGFFFLSSSGELTWNLVPSSVPLPPAVWLFASGLLGLIAIGRRRQSGLGAAV